MSSVFTSGLLCLQAGCVEGRHRQEDSQSFTAGAFPCLEQIGQWTVFLLPWSVTCAPQGQALRFACAERCVWVGGPWGKCICTFPKLHNGQARRGTSAFRGGFRMCICDHVHLPHLRGVRLGPPGLLTRAVCARDPSPKCLTVSVSVFVF